MIAFPQDRPRRGFTLVELLTVMGILGILVAMVVGAAHGILQHAARTETEQTLRTIEAGLSKYYDDWHRFPWYEYDNPKDPFTVPNQWRGGYHPMMRGVAEEYCPLGAGDANKGDPAAACLYASLTMDQRNGPYAPGAAGNVDRLTYEDEKEYMVFVDGWGRPVHYFQPPPKPGSERPAKAEPQHAEYYYTVPLLMSEGPEKDMPGMADTKEDNIYNYPVDTTPADNLYYQ